MQGSAAVLAPGTRGGSNAEGGRAEGRHDPEPHPEEYHGGRLGLHRAACGGSITPSPDPSDPFGLTSDKNLISRTLF